MDWCELNRSAETLGHTTYSCRKLCKSRMQQGERMYQEGLEWPIMPEAADSIRLLLLVHWPVPEGHARSSIVAHLRRMVCAALTWSADGIESE